MVFRVDYDKGPETDHDADSRDGRRFANQSEHCGTCGEVTEHEVYGTCYTVKQLVCSQCRSTFIR